MRSRSSALLLALAMATVAPLAMAQEPSPSGDPLDAQREKFRAGLEKYRTGAYAEAILIWEPIYAELGPVRGYRLAFNLGRAYEQFGNPTRAAESYESYLAEVERRREAGEPLEPLVEKQETEAKERLTELGATQGRIRIAGDRSVIVRIDEGTERVAPPTGLVVYVTPNREHTITFNPGMKDEVVDKQLVEAGNQLELTPPEPKPEPPPEIKPPPPPPPLRFETREEHPFHKNVLYVAAGVTAISVLVPVILYANAGSVKDDYDASVAQARSDPNQWASASNNALRQRSDYDAAKSTAYASLAIPAVLAVATAGLTAFWLFGKKEVRIPISAGVTPSGGAASLSGRF